MRPLCSVSLAVAALFGAGAVSCAQAGAPLHLVGSAPAKDSHVPWPKELRLDFSAALKPASVAVSMIRPDGQAIPTGAPLAAPGDRSFTTEVKQPTLPGPYMIEWRGLSASGAPVSGDYTFFVQ